MFASIFNRIRQFGFHQLGLPKNINEHISKVYIRKFLPSEFVMIDCGAHHGTDTVEWAKMKGVTVHAFEPSPKVHEVLLQRTTPFQNVHCYKLALSDKNGRASFYISEGSSDGSSSLLEPKDHISDHPDVHFNEVVEVDTITLDDWATQNNIPGIDMMWLDMQGYEMQMLKASEKILDKVKVIVTEVSVKNTYAGVVLYPEFRAWLITKGFIPRLECIPDGYDMGNVLFTRS